MADVINEVKNVGATFTNWDTCMSKTYCKWPVVAAIILAALIILSVVWCIASCLCCGVALCDACVKCVTCCGCCGMCKGGGRRRKDPEYHPMPPTPTPYQGYQPQPNSMMYNNHGPQFATFDANSKRGVHEDSLPAMPSWDNSNTRRVEDHSQPRGSELEMEHMLPHSQQTGPLSPVRQSPYRQAQPYASDLGAQRLDQNRGYNNDYYDPPTQPLSPAPTYYSTVPPVGGALAPSNRDRFLPQHDNYENPYDRGHSPNAAPYPSSRESRQFAAQRSMSPPSAPAYDLYQEHPQAMTQPRIGRKPVAGSYREV